MFRRAAGIFAGCLLAAACGTPAGLAHTDIPHLAGTKVVFDQALIDPANHQLYLADSGQSSIDVFDVAKASPRFLTSIKVGHPPHGLALAADLHKVFAGLDGGGIAVIEADPGSNGVHRVLTTIQTAAKKNVDLLDYDPEDHLLWAAAADDGMLFKVDAIRNLVVGRLTLLPGLEQPRYDATEKAVFLPDQGKNLIYKIDPARLAVVAQWNIGVPCAPAGMAIDAKRDVALIGCLDPAAGHTIAWNLGQGRLIRTLVDITAADQVIYDSGTDTFMVAGSSSGTTAIGFFGGSPPAYRNLKLTHADTRAVAYDPSNQVVYTPDAKPGSEGLISFPLPQRQGQAPPFLAPLLYLLPLAIVGFIVWYFGRRRQQERRAAGRPIYS